jgi:hypothetical protein
LLVVEVVVLVLLVVLVADLLRRFHQPMVVMVVMVLQHFLAILVFQLIMELLDQLQDVGLLEVVVVVELHQYLCIWVMVVLVVEVEFLR